MNVSDGCFMKTLSSFLGLMHKKYQSISLNLTQISTCQVVHCQRDHSFLVYRHLLTKLASFIRSNRLMENESHFIFVFEILRRGHWWAKRVSWGGGTSVTPAPLWICVWEGVNKTSAGKLLSGVGWFKMQLHSPITFHNLCVLHVYANARKICGVSGTTVALNLPESKENKAMHWPPPAPQAAWSF